MNNFLKSLKKIFIGERAPLPITSPVSAPIEPPKVAAPVELSCLAKGIIKSLDDDNDTWKEVSMLGGYRHFDTQIYVNEAYSDGEMGGSYLEILPEILYDQLSEHDRERIIASVYHRKIRKGMKEYEKQKAFERKQAQPSIDYFSKLGCQ